MRPMWSGSITFGLVSVPVQLHSALNYNDVSFNLLHDECKTRIKQQTYCPHCERVVERKELVRGYQYAKDQYVIMEDKDFEELEVAATRSIDVLAFVDLDKVDPIYFSRPYYLTPEGDSQKPFALFTQAMEDSRKAAVVKFVMREKEYVGCIAPHGKSLVLYVMHHRDDVKDVKDFGVDYKGQVRDKEVQLAQQIIENLTEPFDPDFLKDEYQEKLQEILEQKAQGREIKLAPAKRPPAKVVNLMDALKQSVLATAKEKGKPAAGTSAVEKKRRKA